MYLMGNFLVANLPEDMQQKMGYFQFPSINPEVGMAEDAPMDTLHIPAKARTRKMRADSLSLLPKLRTSN